MTGWLSLVVLLLQVAKNITDWLQTQKQTAAITNTILVELGAQCEAGIEKADRARAMVAAAIAADPSSLRDDDGYRRE